MCAQELAGRRRSEGDAGATGTWLTPQHACEAAVLLMVERGACQQQQQQRRQQPRQRRADEGTASQTIAQKEEGKCKRAR